MASLPSELPSSLSTSRTNLAQTNCFPTTSRSLSSRAEIAPSQCSLSIDDHYRKLCFVPHLEVYALPVPLIIAHRYWGYTHHGDSNSRKTFTPSPPLPTVIGSAFKRCLSELKTFVSWDDCNFCPRVHQGHKKFIDEKLDEFEYYVDVHGRYQEGLAPRHSPSTARTRARAGRTATTTAQKASTVAKQNSACQPNETWAKGAEKTSAPCTGLSALAESSMLSTTTTNQQRMSTSATPVDMHNVAFLANAVPTSTAASTANNSPSRTQAKRRDRFQPDSLLLDCGRFTTFTSSNACTRTHLSVQASLADVIRDLNRAVLRFSVDNGDNMIYVELASLVALLNYAAAFYHDIAERIETYMQIRIGQQSIDRCSQAIYATRASYIEAEENNSEACDKPKVEAEREERRSELQSGFLNMVPDMMDLRDGVQTVLFTFVWINYTAYKGFDAAMRATLHVVIPLLETVVVRCARQVLLVEHALSATHKASKLDQVQNVNALDVQLDLLNLGAALQNVSGCGLALFTSSDKHIKAARGWKESLVNCPYSVHLYSAALTDMAFQILAEVHMAVAMGGFAKLSSKVERRCKQGCACSSMHDRIREMSRFLTLVEKEQIDWKPLVRRAKARKKGNKKRNSKAKPSSTVHKDERANQGWVSDISSNVPHHSAASCEPATVIRPKRCQPPCSRPPRESATTTKHG